MRDPRTDPQPGDVVRWTCKGRSYMSIVTSRRDEPDDAFMCNCMADEEHGWLADWQHEWMRDAAVLYVEGKP